MIAMLMLTTLLPTAVAEWDPIELVHFEEVEGSVSYGLRIESNGGQFSVFVMALAPRTSDHVSAGVVQVDDAGNTIAQWRWSDDGSGGRIVSSMASADYPEWLSVEQLTTPEGTALVGIGLLAAPAPPPGVYRFVAWVAGGETSQLQVFGMPGLQVQAERGAAFVLSDRDLRGGAMAQVQPVAGFHVYPDRMEAASVGVGAKAISGATIDVGVRGKLYGYWEVTGTKRLCSNGGCAQFEHVRQACANLAQSDCAKPRISYSDHEKTVSGSTQYFIDNAPRGVYSFRVDFNVDGWVGHVDSGKAATAVNAEEYAVMLTIVDAHLPPV